MWGAMILSAALSLAPAPAPARTEPYRHRLLTDRQSRSIGLQKGCLQARAQPAARSTSRARISVRDLPWPLTSAEDRQSLRLWYRERIAALPCVICVHRSRAAP